MNAPNSANHHGGVGMSGTNLGRGRGRWTPRDKERNNLNGPHDRPGNFPCTPNDLSGSSNVNTQLKLGVYQNLFQADSEGRRAQQNINIQQNHLMTPDAQAELSPLEPIMVRMLEDGHRRELTLMQLVENLSLNHTQALVPTLPAQSPEDLSYHIMPDLSKGIGKFNEKLETSRARE